MNKRFFSIFLSILTSFMFLIPLKVMAEDTPETNPNGWKEFPAGENTTYVFINFVDENNPSADMSKYKTLVKVPENTTKAIDFSDTVSLLKEDGYTVKDASKVPSEVDNFYNFVPSPSYSGKTNAIDFPIYLQYDNPRINIPSDPITDDDGSYYCGNLADNGCVPTAMSMMLYGYGITASPESMGWYLHYAGSFDICKDPTGHHDWGRRGHGGTDAAAIDTANYASNRGVPLKYKIIENYDDFVNALKAGATVSLGMNNHQYIASGYYNNGYTTTFDAYYGKQTNQSVKTIWNARAQGSPFDTTISPTSMIAIDKQRILNYDVTVAKTAQKSSVVFNDINERKQDLSNYTLDYEISEKQDIDISDTIEELTNKNYEIKSEVPTSINPGETLTVNVDHMLAPKTALKTEYLFRKINFLNSDGSVHSSPVEQRLEVVVDSGTTIIDLVTNDSWRESDGSVTFTDSDTFPAFSVEQEEGYVIDPVEIPELKVEDPSSFKPIVINVTYTKTETPVSEAVVIFNDINENKQDLSSYTYSKKISEEEAVGEDFLKTIEELRNKNYIIDNIPSTLIPGKTITVDVDHKITALGGAIVPYTDITRKINFLDEGGNEMFPSVVQTISYREYGPSTETDEVTGVTKILSEGGIAFENDINKFDEVISPAKDGYTPDKASVASLEFSKDMEKETIVNVVYSKNESPLLTSKIVFNDLNDDKQNLSNHTITYEINEEKSIDISEKINELKQLGYEIKSEIPTSINPNETITINVDHTYKPIEASSALTYVIREIKFVYEDGTEFKKSIVQTLPYISSTGEYKEDIVTGKEIEIKPGFHGFSDGDTFPELYIEEENGYVPDKTYIPELKASPGNAYNEVVTFTKKENKQTATISFNDINERKQDLSKYTLTYEISEATEINISDKVKELQDAFYIIKSEIPTSINPGETITIDVDHFVSDAPAVSGEWFISRIIRFVYEDGSEFRPQYVQTLTYVDSSGVYKKDYVTNDTLECVQEPFSGFVDGNDTFPELHIDIENNYAPNPSYIPALKASRGDGPYNVTVVFSKLEKVVNDVKISVINTEDDSDDMSSYEKVIQCYASDFPSAVGNAMDEISEVLKNNGYEIVDRKMSVAGHTVTPGLDMDYIGIDEYTAEILCKRSSEQPDEPSEEVTFDTKTEDISRTIHIMNGENEINSRTQTAKLTTTTKTIRNTSTDEITTEVSYSGLLPEYHLSLSDFDTEFYETEDNTTIPSVDFSSGKVDYEKDIYIHIKKKNIQLAVPVTVKNVEDASDDMSKYSKTVYVPLDGADGKLKDEISIIAGLIAKENYIVVDINSNLVYPGTGSYATISCKKVKKDEPVVTPEKPSKPAKTDNGSSNTNKSDKSNQNTNTASTVVTCQMAGFPAGWYWDESKKACVAPAPSYNPSYNSNNTSGTYQSPRVVARGNNTTSTQQQNTSQGKTSQNSKNDQSVKDNKTSENKTSDNTLINSTVNNNETTNITNQLFTEVSRNAEVITKNGSRVRACLITLKKPAREANNSLSDNSPKYDNKKNSTDGDSDSIGTPVKIPSIWDRLKSLFSWK